MVRVNISMAVSLCIQLLDQRLRAQPFYKKESKMSSHWKEKYGNSKGRATTALAIRICLNFQYTLTDDVSINIMYLGGEPMALTADILRGYTDTIILRQLAAGDSYGYQINKQVAQITDGIFEMKEATLYTAFRRLEGAGLIRAYWGDEQSGARRRYYALTESGRERLRQDCLAWQETRRLLDRLLEP